MKFPNRGWDYITWHDLGKFSMTFKMRLNDQFFFVITFLKFALGQMVVAGSATQLLKVLYPRIHTRCRATQAPLSGQSMAL